MLTKLELVRSILSSMSPEDGAEYCERSAKNAKTAAVTCLVAAERLRSMTVPEHEPRCCYCDQAITGEVQRSGHSNDRNEYCSSHCVEQAEDEQELARDFGGLVVTDPYELFQLRVCHAFAHGGDDLSVLKKKIGEAIADFELRLRQIKRESRS